MTMTLLILVALLVLMLALFLVDDVIVRHICQREGWRYSIFWVLNFYWHRRIFGLGWYEDAKEAGYLVPRLIIFALWAVLILGLGFSAISGRAPVIRV